MSTERKKLEEVVISIGPLSPEEEVEIERIRTALMLNRLAILDNPGLINPEIPLSDLELDAFLQTFAETDQGIQLHGYINAGSKCESMGPEKDPSKRCGEPAVGSVDWRAETFEDSVLVCRDHVRFVYASLMTDDVRKNGLVPVLTINGKEIPRYPQAEA